MRDSDSGAPVPGTRSGRSFWRIFRAVLLLCSLGLTGFLVFEGRTSFVQSRYFSSVAARMTFRVEPGGSSQIRFPSSGPRDERLGYVDLAVLADTLHKQGFRIVSQARMSEEMLLWAERGIGPIYPEKTQAGLEVVDRAGRALYSARYPERVFASFDSIPELIVGTLLFIENRELLQNRYPYRNPAVEWDRLGKAALEEGLRRFQPERNVAGGSTLATQIEKFRHAPGGWTAGPKDKARQMIAASLRTYQRGRETAGARREIFLDYLNSIPLAAAPGFGEVNGLGDGLFAWFGEDLDTVTRLLRDPSDARALAYREVLSLLLAQRRPSYYLLQNRGALEALTDSYLRILASEGVIEEALRDRALAAGAAETRGTRAGDGTVALRTRRAENKTAVSIRSLLVSLLAQSDLYAVDRMDLRVVSSIDSLGQRNTAQLLGRLEDPEFARESRLLDPRMLRSDDLESVIYSFTLYERVSGGNLLRVQADNYPGALNLNENARLELGSTAKLRTLANYLQIVADLHRTHSGRSPEELHAVSVHPRDPLTRWVIQYLLAHPGATEDEILEAAVERRYSANPDEGFFTGGGLHHFANFDHRNDHEVVSVREGLRQSVNLVFIRLMRDIVQYYTYRGSGPAARFLEDTGDTLRQVYLERFADREGSEFLRRFYRTYRSLSPTERESVFFDGVRKTPRALAMSFRALRPEADAAEMQAFLLARLPNATVGDRETLQLYDACAPGTVGLEDQGYLARVHPLELWLVAYLGRKPGASLQEVLGASRDERRQVYAWLYRTKRKNAQDERIRVLLEVEAFLEIQRAWARFGYPFENLVPSYATAIGSSGDRPAALADLVGIIVGGGVRQPNMRVLGLSFADGTPYETNLERVPQSGEQVMDPAVARLLQRELVGVVEAGTARRALGAVKLKDGTVLPVGGKTGTGDNRIKVYGTGGRLVQSKAMSRTATFVFLVGDRFYGTIVAYVPGADADRYAFTSALPVQIFATLAPALEPVFSAPLPAEFGDKTPVATPVRDPSEPGPQPDTFLRTRSISTED